MKDRPSARDAYVRAEVTTALAHQVRAIRQDRGWTQADLAKKLGTTQAVISRLENPEYGAMNLKTLFDLSKVFDTGLNVQFVSLVSMLRDTFHVSHQDRLVEPFERESERVGFFDKIPQNDYSPPEEVCDFGYLLNSDNIIDSFNQRKDGLLIAKVLFPTSEFSSEFFGLVEFNDMNRQEKECV